MENTVLKVTGMSCGGCVKSVTNVLTALPGVSNAEVTLTPGEAKVEFDPAQVSVEAMKQAVADAGFEAG
jgi:copper chaperone